MNELHKQILDEDNLTPQEQADLEELSLLLDMLDEPIPSVSGPSSELLQTASMLYTLRPADLPLPAKVIEETVARAAAELSAQQMPPVQRSTRKKFSAWFYSGALGTAAAVLLVVMVNSSPWWPSPAAPGPAVNTAAADASAVPPALPQASLNPSAAATEQRMPAGAGMPAPASPPGSRQDVAAAPAVSSAPAASAPVPAALPAPAAAPAAVEAAPPSVKAALPPPAMEKAPAAKSAAIPEYRSRTKSMAPELYSIPENNVAAFAAPSSADTAASSLPPPLYLPGQTPDEVQRDVAAGVLKQVYAKNTPGQFTVTQRYLGQPGNSPPANPGNTVTVTIKRQEVTVSGSLPVSELQKIAAKLQ